MIRLSTNRQMRWLALPHGVKVEVRPLTTAINQAALTDARKRVAALSIEADAASKAGQPMDALGANGANAAWLEGMWSQLYAEALGRYGINRWEGLTGDDGQPLPVSPDAIAAMVAHPDLGIAFTNAYGADLAAEVAEGNVSARSSDGNLPEANADASTAKAPLVGQASKAPKGASAGTAPA